MQAAGAGSGRSHQGIGGHAKSSTAWTTRRRRSSARNCLLARRLVERGVRFVELYCGSGSGWDAHNDIEGNHSQMCHASDKPIAGLLTDLKARGLLE